MAKPKLRTIAMPEPEGTGYLRRRMRANVFGLMHDLQQADAELAAATVDVVVDGWRITLNIEPDAAPRAD